MNPGIIGRILAILAALVATSPALAGEQGATLDKIRASGKIVLGVRESSYPLSYFDAGGKAIGYHIDICHRIVAAVQARLGLPALTVEARTVTSQNRIPLMVDGSIDLECGSTTNNLARQKLVAFAPTTFVTTVRAAVKKSSGITSLAQLDGKIVVTTAGSTGMQLLLAKQHGGKFAITELYGNDHAESFHLLETDRAAAFVIDDNLLAGLIAVSAAPDQYRILDAVINVEPIAIMLRKNDPAFKALVDDTVIAMMKAGEIDQLYTKWFLSPIPPKNVNLNFPMGMVLANMIRFPGDEPAETFGQSE